MMLKKIKPFITRVLLLYIAVFVCCNLLTDNQKIKNAYHVRTLNASIPKPYHYHHLLSILEHNDENINPRTLNQINFYYKKAIEFRPDMTAAWGLLGATYAALGQHQKALEAYNHVSKKYPDWFWAHYNAGIIYHKEKKYDLAAQSLTLAMQANEKSTILKTLHSPMIYGPVLKTAGITGPKELQNELLIAKQNANALLLKCYLTLNQTPRAVQHINLGKKIDPKRETFYNYALAQIALKNNKGDQAVKIAQKILVQNPYQIDTLVMMKEILNRVDKKKAAAVIQAEIDKSKKLGRLTFSEQLARISLKPY